MGSGRVMAFGRYGRVFFWVLVYRFFFLGFSFLGFLFEDLLLNVRL